MNRRRRRGIPRTGKGGRRKTRTTKLTPRELELLAEKEEQTRRQARYTSLGRPITFHRIDHSNLYVGMMEVGVVAIAIVIETDTQGGTTTQIEWMESPRH